jgi:hypothetical protein
MFFAEDAAFYIEKAIEAIEEGSHDPELYLEQQLELAQAFHRIVPYIVRRRSLSRDRDAPGAVLDRIESGFGSPLSDYVHSSAREPFEDLG